MIIYIFNNSYDDNSGFSKRCRKEIDILSCYEPVHVICRPNIHLPKTANQKTNIFFNYFNTFLPNNTHFDKYKFPIFIELLRNMDLFISFSKTLIITLLINRKNEPKIYAIVSPLTIPLICVIYNKLFNAKASVVEFHDLEPEMAIHIKKLNNKSHVLKVEYFLEKIVCRLFNKIIVTTQKQKEILLGRTKIKESKIEVIYNSIHADIEQININNNKIIKSLINKKLKIGMISSFSYDYTISGLIKLIEYLSYDKKYIDNFLFIVVGDGEKLNLAKKLVEKNNLSENFLFTGRISEVKMYLQSFDVAIIPWEQDIMSNNILPTKLFEYMMAGKPIIAPNFGEFTKILIHNNNSLLFNSVQEAISFLQYIYMNKNKSNELGEKARITYSRLKHTDKYLKFIKNLH